MRGGRRGGGLGNDAARVAGERLRGVVNFAGRRRISAKIISQSACHATAHAKAKSTAMNWPGGIFCRKTWSAPPGGGRVPRRGFQSSVTASLKCRLPAAVRALISVVTPARNTMLMCE